MACPDADTFNALVAGQLDSETRAGLADHAAACHECHALLDTLIDDRPRDAGKADGNGPDRIDRYVIERRIGAGAMGVVYAARDPELARRVAIKVLRGGGSAARLKREAQLLARLQHPNVVAVYDVGEHDGQTFVAMALVDGENLRDWLAKPHTTDEVLRVIRDAGRGLAAAHAADLIHRDLKPDNIFVGHDGTVQVGDFGLARSDGELDAAASGSLGMELTQTGMVLGTPAYMAPEHAAGEPTTASDQFSFCVTAWEALYGRRPFAARTYDELRAKIVARELGDVPEGRRVPVRVRAALERGLSADPADRFPSIDALLAAFAPPRRRWPWIAGGAVAGGAAVAVALAMHAGGGPSCDGTEHELDAIWNAAARAKLGEPSAQQLVDGYTRDWRALRHDACVASRGSGDLRTSCLDRARGALRGLLAGLGPDTDPDRLHEAILRLPAIGDCRSPLQGAVSDTDRMAGEQLLARISEAEVRATLQGTTVLDELHALEAEANHLGYEPAIVAVGVDEGRAYATSGQRDAAARVLRHALSLAEAGHDDLGVARTAAELGPVLIGLGKLDEARALVELAAAALARTGSDPEIEIRITDVRAQLASASGDHDTAIRLATSLIEPMKARTGAESVEVGSLYVMLAREYVAAGRMDDARKAGEQARFGDLARARSAHAADVVALDVKINNAFLAGETKRAIELSRQFVALARENHDRAIELEAAQTLARAYELAGDGQMMVASYQAVLDHLGAGATPEQRGEALEGLGRGYIQLGQRDRALAPLQQAFEIDTAGGAALAANRASAAVALGDVLVELGKPRDARAVIEPVLRALVDDPAAMPQRRGGAEFVFARALWDDGGDRERARARALAADALQHYQQAAAKNRAAGGLALVTTLLEDRIAAITTWQRRHP